MLLLPGMVACNDVGKKVETHEQGRGVQEEKQVEASDARAVYYWKTVMELSEEDLKFVRNHGIGKMYVRFFDVDMGQDFDGRQKALPNATLQFCDTIPDNIEIVPVVFVSVQSLREWADDLATPLYTRVRAMCKAHGIDRVHEIQLDCDWTVSTRNAFYKLCSEVRQMAHQDGISLSATIRLHQLSGEAPPVDKGALMLYNTGNIYDEQEENSILSYKDAEPYLRKDIRFGLPLSLALPTFQWAVTYRDGEFMCILHNQDFEDRSLYSPYGKNRLMVMDTQAVDGNILNCGDEVRLECPDMENILRVKKLAMKQIKDSIEGMIIYHLDATNLANYTFDEVEEMLKK